MADGGGGMTGCIGAPAAMTAESGILPAEIPPVRPVLALTPLALALSLAVLLPACSRPSGDAGAPAATSATEAATPEQIAAESARLNAWFDDQYEQLLQFSPIQLSFLGRKDLNDRLDDMSEAGIRKQEAWLAASVQAMESGFPVAVAAGDAEIVSAIEAAGGRAFQMLAVPEAAVALKQGAGRLIRHESDRGVLVVCDTRLVGMGYGKRIRAALPPMRILKTEDEFQQALEGLGPITKSSTTANPWA